MAKAFSRVPRNYDGTLPTARQMRSLLPAMMQALEEHHSQKPDEILKAWKEIIGEDLSPMAEAVSFNEGMLVVKVKNSTLLSLLSMHEKERLLKRLRQRFPSVQIRTIIFRLG